MSVPSEKTRPRRDLVKLLASSVGVEKARECVTGAAHELGLASEELTQRDALSVLEHIAGQPGIVGITARFAKSRVHLLWKS
jgi:hypothetical protein